MNVIFPIVIIVLVVSAIIGFFKSRHTLEGAGNGFFVALSILWDVFLLGLIVYGVIWVFRVVFS